MKYLLEQEEYNSFLHNDMIFTSFIMIIQVFMVEILDYPEAVLMGVNIKGTIIQELVKILNDVN